MIKSSPGRAFLPILVLFLVSTLLVVVMRSLLIGWNTDYRVLLAGNTLLFVVTAISFYLYSKSLQNSNPHAFVRIMYVSLLVKLFVVAAATILYIRLAGPPNKSGILGSFAFYFLYTFLEVKILTKLLRKPAAHA